MELQHRVGIFVKYKNGVKVFPKSFFFIDADSTLYYTSKENVFLEVLKTESLKEAVEILKANSKQIKLNTCSISPSVKPYTEKNIPDMLNRSHIKIFEKTGNFRILILFALKEENTSALYQVVTGKLPTLSHSSSSMTDNTKSSPVLKPSSSKITEVVYFDEGSGSKEFFNDISIDSLFKRDEKSAEDVLVRLGGKLVNQKDWTKKVIRSIDSKEDPSGQEVINEEFATLENGSTYSGPIKGGMPFGIGKEFRQDGNLYQGNFLEGKWHGEGTITNANLETYKAEFIDGCISGI